MLSRELIPHIGIYTPSEVSFLWSLVRAVLWQSGCTEDPRKRERIARSILNAYSSGIQDRRTLQKVGMMEAGAIAGRISACKASSAHPATRLMAG